MPRSQYPKTGLVTTSYVHIPSWLNFTIPITPPLGWILVIHGLNGSALGGAQGSTWQKCPYVFCEKGYGMVCPSISNWPSAASRTKIDDAYNDIKTLSGLTTPKICVIATSDGSGQFLDWVAQGTNDDKIEKAWLCNPLTDPRWGYALGGYAPAYDTGGISPNAGWPSDMDTQFSGNWSANSPGYRINDNIAGYQGLSCKIRLAQAPDDATLPPAAAQWFKDQVNDPNLTIKTSLTGGHGNQGNYDPEEILAFLRWGNVAA